MAREIGKSALLGISYGGDAMAKGTRAHMALNPIDDNPRRASNQRFRSFAERYIIERAKLFRADPEGLSQDTWACTLDAKRAYNLIKQVGYGVED